MILESWTKEVVGELRQMVKVGNILKVEAVWRVVVLDVGYDRNLVTFQMFLLEDLGCHYGYANG